MIETSKVEFPGLGEKYLTVIVPVFNEGKNIIQNLELLFSEIEPYFKNYEILVISDGSTDDTDKMLRELNHPHVRTILKDRNRGKGHTIRQGFFEAKGDFVFFIDGGMELHPKEIRTFLGLQVLYSADIVLGSKRHPQSEVYYPATRRFLSLCYQYLIRHFFDLDVTDTQVGFKLFRKEVIEAIRHDLSIDRYGFDLEVLAIAKMKGYGKMLEAPIRLDYFGKNTRSGPTELLHIFKVGYHVLKDTLRVYAKIRKMRSEVGLVQTVRPN